MEMQNHPLTGVILGASYLVSALNLEVNKCSLNQIDNMFLGAPFEFSESHSRWPIYQLALFNSENRRVQS